MKKISLLLFSAFLFFSCSEDSKSFINAAGLYNAYNVQSNIYDAKIIEVIDGDTLKIRFDYDKPKQCTTEETVRLIGVDTPEMNYYSLQEPEYYAQEATDYTNQFLNYKIMIEFDDVSSLRDKYKRLLGYIWIENYRLLNKELISEGYGKYYSNFSFNSKRMSDFSEAQEKAIQNGKGMWQ